MSGVLWFVLICNSQWGECQRPVPIPQAQCQALINHSLKDWRVACFTDTGGTVRQQELASR